MTLPNDTRGWIMTCVSGIACVFGSSIICVDLIVQRFPGKRKWRIQDSDVFLSASLSLSFGVMMFSSLYSMLPSAQQYLQRGGVSPKAAAWLTIGTFLAGVLGIQVFSRLLHHYIPSHVVDCENPHEETGAHSHTDPPMQEHHHHHRHHHDHSHNGSAAETTPLIPQPDLKLGTDQSARLGGSQTFDAPYTSAPSSRRPTLNRVFTSGMSSFVGVTKTSCEEGGPCYGYTDPGGRQCLRTVSRSPTRRPTRIFGRLSSANPGRPSNLIKTSSSFRGRGSRAPSIATDEESPAPSPLADTQAHTSSGPGGHSHDHHPSTIAENEDESSLSPKASGKGRRSSSSATDLTVLSVEDQPHHHHVPENAFLSIGLQTSIAIALHKLPEGFITYATNHANPQLGFSVFMALFIHNISEGFAMALPLYLAINSRAKAMFWSSLLGGVSQPFGAGVAALWFYLAGDGGLAPDDKVYGCMFSITAGIMASVALQLFSESLSLTHNRNICTIFAFIGMGILGASRALTAR